MEKHLEFTLTGKFETSNQLRVRVSENYWEMMINTFQQGHEINFLDVIDCKTGKEIWINFKRVTSIIDIREVEANGQD